MGHEDQFRPPSLSGRCRISQGTLAGMGGKEEDAPKAAVRATAVEPSVQPFEGRSVSRGIHKREFLIRL